MVRPTRDLQVLIEPRQDAQFGIEGLIFGPQEGGELPGNAGGQMCGEIMVGSGAHRAGIGGEFAGGVEHFLLGFRFAEAALAPFEEVCLLMGSPAKPQASMAGTPGMALSHWRRVAPSSSSARRRLSSARRAGGRRAIFPLRRIIIYFVMAHEARFNNKLICHIVKSKFTMNTCNFVGEW